MQKLVEFNHEVSIKLSKLCHWTDGVLTPGTPTRPHPGSPLFHLIRVDFPLNFITYPTFSYSIQGISLHKDISPYYILNQRVIRNDHFSQNLMFDAGLLGIKINYSLIGYMDIVTPTTPAGINVILEEVAQVKVVPF